MQEVFDFNVEIIIPIGERSECDVLERLLWRRSYNLPKNFSITVAEYGSSLEFSNKISDCCNKINAKHIHINSNDGIWNASKARNAAILESVADYLFFEDVDLLSHVDFYHDINNEINSSIITKKWPFLVVPVAYLADTSAFREPLSKYDYSILCSEIFDPDSLNIDFYAAASSYLLCARKDAIMLGGYDESFKGWGYEDSDFWYRLLTSLQIEKPRNFYKLDTRNYSNQTQWEGWRSLFRIFADIVALKGIYAFHVYHAESKDKLSFLRERNKYIFTNNIARYTESKNIFIPMVNLGKEVDLFLSKNPHSFNRALFEIFDNPLFIQLSNINIQDIDELVSRFKIRRVIFDNPYANEKRLEIYLKFKKIGITTYVVERGALPNSIYIDKNGFCAESRSYEESNWAFRELTDGEKREINSYIVELKLNNITLEKQGNLIGHNNLKKRLFGDSEDVKILFIALQSPSDTTTNYFCGDIGSYEGFLKEMYLLPYLLPKNWRVVYKNHPLTIDKVNIEGGYCVDDYHINEIIEISDAVTLINSGVGLLSIIFSKPVYYFGSVFYGVRGLNKKVKDSSELAIELTKPFNFEDEIAKKFLYFLVFEFYSFAEWNHEIKPYTKDANLSISKNIRYTVVRVYDLKKVFKPQRFELDLKRSILFDRYRLDDYLNRKKTSGYQASTKVNLASKKQNSLFFKKLKKLIRSPKLFFYDAIGNFKSQ